MRQKTIISLLLKNLKQAQQIIEEFKNKNKQIYGIITEDVCDEETGKRQGFYLKNNT